MRPFAFPIAAAVLVGCLTSSAQSRPDFSGTWEMDPSRSESAHQDVPIGPVVLLIRQTADRLRLETRRTESNSSAVSTETLTFRLDGTEETVTGESGVAIKLKAHWDASKLVMETERKISGSTLTTLQVFQLSREGEEISIDKTLTIQHGYEAPGPERTKGTGRDVFLKTATKG